MPGGLRFRSIGSASTLRDFAGLAGGLALRAGFKEPARAGERRPSASGEAERVTELCVGLDESEDVNRNEAVVEALGDVAEGDCSRPGAGAPFTLTTLAGATPAAFKKLGGTLVGTPPAVGVPTREQPLLREPG